jgi:hypothetical protein
VERLNLWPEEADVALPRPPPEPSKGRTPWADLFDGNGVRGVQPLTEYADNPAGFLVEVLGLAPETIEWSLVPEYAGHTWDGTQDPMKTAMRALVEGRWVAISRGTGVGKTLTAAALSLWFLACHEEARVFTLANDEKQLMEGLWMEIARLFPKFKARFPTAELTHLRLRVAPEEKHNAWAMSGMLWTAAADGSVAGNRGRHAKWMLFIVDEAPGVPPAVIGALENTCTKPDTNLIVLLGNPERSVDTLAQFGEHPRVERIRISALDHPNVVRGREIVPGATSRAFVEDRRLKLGEDDPDYIARVRGMAPDQSANGLFQLAWLEAAATLHAEIEAANPYTPEGKDLVSKWKAGGRALGVDVANREGGDKAAVAFGDGAVLGGVMAQRCPDANVLGAQVAAEAQAAKIAGARIAVDGTGVGAGTINELKRLGVRALNFVSAGASIPDGGTEVYANLRAQAWWRLREDLRFGRVAIPKDKELWKELLRLRWSRKGGKILIESKDRLRARLGKSPDKADAVMMWNWVRGGAGTMIPESMVRKPTHIAFY